MDPLGGQPYFRNKSVSKEELIIHILLRDVSEFHRTLHRKYNEIRHRWAATCVKGCYKGIVVL